MSARTDLAPVSSAANAVASAAREQMLTTLLRSLGLIGLLVAGLVLLLARDLVDSWPHFLFFAGASLVIAGLGFVRRLPYALRAFIFLTSVFTAGALELARAGLVGDGRLWLFGFALFAILFAGPRLGVVAGLSSVLLVALTGILVANGQLQPAPAAMASFLDAEDWPLMAAVLMVIVAGLVVSANRLLQSVEASVAGETGLSVSLEQERLQLEQRVANRTRALETSARVARELARILDQDALVDAVVNRVQKAFQYYHVHVYLLSPDGQKLNLVGGTGRPGRQMLANAHFVPAGKGLVGRAAATGQTVLAADVNRDPGWLPNQLLPDTQSELAVPILVGNRIAGVLDVQQNRVGALGDDDIVLLETIAAQVGVALQNANLFAETHRRGDLAGVLADVGRALRRTRTVEDALRVAAQSVGDIVAADQAAVYLDHAHVTGEFARRAPTAAEGGLRR